MPIDSHYADQVISYLTLKQYLCFQKLYDYFNSALFDDKLPACFLSFSRDRVSVVATFRPDRWFKCDLNLNDEQLYHEISLNPLNLKSGNQRVLCSTIVHEMCHAWQADFGKPGRNGYHNRQWAKKMVELGLKPFNISSPAKMTGDAISHRIIPGGKFDKKYNELSADFFLPLGSVDAFKPSIKIGIENDPGNNIRKLPAAVIALLKNKDLILKPVSPVKMKYSCNCQGKKKKRVWGRPGLTGIYCADCGELLEETKVQLFKDDMLESSVN